MLPSKKHDSTITILISTYNGEKYFKEQLESIFQQTYRDFQIMVRDDGSSDSTLDILHSYPHTIIPSKQNLGPSRSFFMLLKSALQESTSEYFMFCDQDDVWESEKIAKSLSVIRQLASKSPDTPLLVHSDLRVVDENMHLLSPSFWEYSNINPKKNQLNRLLMQNTVTGCTVILNRKLAEMCSNIPSDVIMHDWWLGLIASRFGYIYTIPEALVLYRQHQKNDVGAKAFNLINVLLTNSRKKNKSTLIKVQKQTHVFLECFRNHLEINEIRILKTFSELDSHHWLYRRYFVLKYGFIKQGFIRNIGLLLFL